MTLRRDSLLVPALAWCVLASLAGPAFGQRRAATAGAVRQPAGVEQPADEAEAPDGPAGAAGPIAQVGNEADPLITFSQTAEPMDLTALVDLVATTLGINVSIKGELRGSVLFNTGKSVRQSDLLDLLDAMLEQYDFSITYDQESDFYLIQPKANIPVTFESLENTLATTRLIEVPTIKPSSLADPINQVLGAAGQAAGGVSFVDELGLIIITNTPRQIERVQELVNKILARLDKMTLTPIELRYVAAATARDRLISLAGGASAGGSGGAAAAAARNLRRAADPNQAAGIGPTSGGTIENLAERLSVDPQSNALLFRGTPDELARIRTYVGLIDVDNALPSRRHFVGSAARQIAELASGRGLGEVVILDNLAGQSQFGAANRNFQQAGQAGLLGELDAPVAGPTLVVDVQKGEIVYYGTPEQQVVLANMIETLDTEADRIVIREYKLDHAVAEEVAEVIQALLTGQSGVGQNTLLPQSGGVRQQQQFQQTFDGAGGGDGEIGDFDPARVFVVADTPNNQIIVKAPVKQQADFAQLIERLDLRRRQVFIEVLIVSIDDSDDFRFALETQFEAGQVQTQTNFGLSEAGDTFTAPRSPVSTLGGLTTALIKNDYLPFVINAVKNETDGRILSRPQLLVNDNEEARIASVEERQTQTTSQGDNSTIVGVGEPVTAGTTLTVTPGISEAGFLRLEYEIAFDNFIGSGTDTLPPPANRREVNGSVTMPTDTTIVVGGITVENTGSTIVKVPLLGDIPLIGPLFSDTRQNDSNSVLYIFITPRILVDPTFRDLRVLTRGPQFLSDVDLDLPPLEPVAIERVRRQRVPDGGDPLADDADERPDARREDD